MGINVKLGDWREQQSQAYAIRKDVFVLEQKVPDELEWDDMDAKCLHAVACNESGQAVGTGRLLPDGHIGRMAVLSTARNAGVGGLLLEQLMLAAKQRGDKRVMLSAQIRAAGFYSRYGFEIVGDEYLEAGIAHINMEKTFD